jgi:hypothetical protein
METETIKVRFKDCSKEYLEKQFKLQQSWENEILTAWLTKVETVQNNDIEISVLKHLQRILIENVESWNEIELTEYFIGPVFSLVNFNSKGFKIFSWREVKAVVEGIELYGEPDAIIAKGKYTPEIPYFCFNEYKRQEENRGDAAGQCLAPMLVAQELNGHTLPLYGIYVVGKTWNFMVLNGKEYCISKMFVADDEEIFDIFRMLKTLKEIILNYE